MAGGGRPWPGIQGNGCATEARAGAGARSASRPQVDRSASGSRNNSGSRATGRSGSRWRDGPGESIWTKTSGLIWSRCGASRGVGESCAPSMTHSRPLGRCGGVGCGRRSPNSPRTCGTMGLTESGQALSACRRRRLASGIEAQRRIIGTSWSRSATAPGPRRQDPGLTRAASRRDHRARARLVKHRQRGSDLIYEAYVVDIGGSG
jgi:hypothetical protein